MVRNSPSEQVWKEWDKENYGTNEHKGPNKKVKPTQVGNSGNDEVGRKIKKTKKNKGRKKRKEREEARDRWERKKRLGGKKEKSEYQPEPKVQKGEDENPNKEKIMKEIKAQDHKSSEEQSDSKSKKEQEKCKTLKKGDPAAVDKAEGKIKIQDEEKDPEVQGHQTFEGPRTKEEQFHFDILGNDLDWTTTEAEPDTAKLVAEMLGTDSFEMEVDE